MNKTKLLSVLVAVLLALNLLLVGFMFFRTDKGVITEQHSDHVQPKVVIIKKLHFNNDQIDKYQLLINAHRAQIRATEDKIKNLKNKLYALLKSDAINENVKNELIDSLIVCQKHIELTHFNHFQDIKALCNKAQLSQFNALTEELSKLFPRRQKPKHDD